MLLVGTACEQNEQIMYGVLLLALDLWLCSNCTISSTYRNKYHANQFH